MKAYILTKYYGEDRTTVLSKKVIVSNKPRFDVMKLDLANGIHDWEECEVEFDMKEEESLPITYMDLVYRPPDPESMNVRIKDKYQKAQQALKSVAKMPCRYKTKEEYERDHH